MYVTAYFNIHFAISRYIYVVLSAPVRQHDSCIHLRQLLEYIWVNNSDMNSS